MFENANCRVICGFNVFLTGFDHASWLSNAAVLGEVEDMDDLSIS